MFTCQAREITDKLNILLAEYQNSGCFLLTDVYSSTLFEKIQDHLLNRLSTTSSNAVRHREGEIYASRNVLSLCPEILELWQTPELSSLICSLLGSKAGLVRALYFDKPPEQTWSLPWHKDVLISVKQPEKVSSNYSTVRDRLGVPHSQPPLAVLEKMLTIRIHLDEVTTENGPLEILEQSQLDGTELLLTGRKHEYVLTPRGGVFFMHRLLAHASDKSHPGTTRHRRILHLEFAHAPVLPDNYDWYEFYPVALNHS